jgi:hypothetical protein
MNAGRSSGVLRLAGSVLFFSLCSSPPTAFGAGCAPVAARNDYERTIMEASSDKQGCWVRDPNTGTLDFLSDVAPSQGYKPLIRQSAPNPSTAPAPVAHILQHGPNNPSLYPAILGTWEGTYCGLKVGTLRLSAAGPVLTGTATSRSYMENQACDATKGDICTGPTPQMLSCEYLAPRFTGNPSTQVSLTNVGFDGRVVWTTVASGGKNREIQLQLSGGTLISVKDGPDPPTIYRRIP